MVMKSQLEQEVPAVQSSVIQEASMAKQQVEFAKGQVMAAAIRFDAEKPRLEHSRQQLGANAMQTKQ